MAKKKGRGSKSKAKKEEAGIEFMEEEEAQEAEGESPPAEELDLPPAVAALSDQVEQCGVFAEWIDKARSQTDKFRSEIVVKVVSDYTAKYEAVVGEMQPNIREIEEQLAVEREAPQELEAEREAKQTEREELSLRHLIGAMDDDAFKDADNALETALADLQVQLDGMTARRDALAGALERALAAQRLLEESGGKLPDDVEIRGVEVEVVSDAVVPDVDPDVGDVIDGPPAEPEAPAEEEAPIEEAPAEIVVDQDFDFGGVEEVEANPDTSELGDDFAEFEAALGDGFLEDEPAAEEAPAEEAPAEEAPAEEAPAEEAPAEEAPAEEALAEEAPAEEAPAEEAPAEEAPAEEAPAEEPADEPSDAMAGVETEHPDEPVTGQEESEEAGETINAPEMAAFDADDDVVPDSAFEEALGDGEVVADEEVGPVRNARILLRPKQGDEEEIAVTGAVFSVGRGRNNDVQIKNDGKVSRYHCRIIFRDNEYVIEDNKSSNGTIVDGRAIARKALAGGEQIVIGETSLTFFLD